MKFKLKDNSFEAFKWTGGPDQMEDPEWVINLLTARKAEISYPEFTFFDQEKEVKCIAYPGDYVVLHLGQVSTYPEYLFNEIFEEQK